MCAKTQLLVKICYKLRQKDRKLILLTLSNFLLFLIFLEKYNVNSQSPNTTTITETSMETTEDNALILGTTIGIVCLIYNIVSIYRVGIYKCSAMEKLAALSVLRLTPPKFKWTNSLDS